MVVKHFSDIPNNELPGTDFSPFTWENAFQDNFTQKLFIVKPVANQTVLDISICLEPHMKVESIWLLKSLLIF